MPLGPRASHLLDQYLAWATEIQARLKDYEERLIEMGYSKGETWELARRLEEHILVPVMHYTEDALKIEEQVDELFRKRIEELPDKNP